MRHLEEIDTHTRPAAAPDDPVVLSSHGLWNGIGVTELLLPPMGIRHQLVKGHRIAVNIGQPLNVEWKAGGKRKSQRYETGCLGIVPDGEYNDTWWDKELKVIVVALHPGFANTVFGMESISFHEHRGVKDSTVYQMVLSFKRELQHKKFAGKIFGETLGVAFAVHIATEYSVKRKKIIAPKGKLSSLQLKRVIEYCDERMGHDLGIGEMSQQIHLSPFHFSRLFRQTTGFAPYQYLQRRKIERAKQLIRQGKSSLTEISYLLGFADQAHFSNAFKRETGLSPRQFSLH